MNQAFYDFLLIIFLVPPQKLQVLYCGMGDEPMVIVCDMSIEKIVEQAFQDGYLTPAMEAEVGRICDNASELSLEEYIALDRLMDALSTGEVLDDDDDNTGGSSPTPSPRRPGPTPGSYDSAELLIVAAVVRSAIS